MGLGLDECIQCLAAPGLVCLLVTQRQSSYGAASQTNNQTIYRLSKCTQNDGHTMMGGGGGVGGRVGGCGCCDDVDGGVGHDWGLC